MTDILPLITEEELQGEGAWLIINVKTVFKKSEHSYKNLLFTHFVRIISYKEINDERLNAVLR